MAIRGNVSCILGVAVIALSGCDSSSSFSNSDSSQARAGSAPVEMATGEYPSAGTGSSSSQPTPTPSPTSSSNPNQGQYPNPSSSPSSTPVAISFPAGPTPTPTGTSGQYPSTSTPTPNPTSSSGQYPSNPGPSPTSTSSSSKGGYPGIGSILGSLGGSGGYPGLSSSLGSLGGTGGYPNGTVGASGGYPPSSTSSSNGNGGYPNGGVGASGGYPSSSSSGNGGYPGGISSQGGLTFNFYCSGFATQDTGGSDVVASTALELIVTDSSGNVACDVTDGIRQQVLNQSISLSTDCPNLTANSYNIMLVEPTAKTQDLFYTGETQLKSLQISRSSSSSPWQINNTIWGLSVLYDSNLNNDSVCMAMGNDDDPLMIDVMSDNAPDADLMLTAPAAGVLFDILGANSFPTAYTKKQISWIKNPAEYMFLALPNSAGQVLGIDQLFGNNTLGPDGKFAANGFKALAKYDSNGDGVIDANDPVFKDLRLWSDANGDGVAQSSELFSLDDLGITQISLKYNRNFKEQDQYGNQFRYSAQVMQKGQARISFDVWFKVGGTGTSSK